MVWGERRLPLTIPIPSVSIPKMVKNGYKSDLARAMDIPVVMGILSFL